MEDTFICLGKWAYSFRIDKSEVDLMNEVQWILNKTSKYLLREEKGDKTNKVHLQGILWFPKKLCTKDTIKYRNHFRREKGGISFISAKKVKSLSAYCNKSEGELITNLTTFEISQIPKWLNQKDIWKIELEKFLTTISKRYNEPTQQQDFVITIIEYYIQHEKAPPNRNTLYKQLLKYYKFYTYTNYISDINLFSNNY